MPISYEVCNDGHAIITIADGILTADEFIEYEVAHAIDESIRSPVAELLIVKHNALAKITVDDVRKVLKRREEIERKPTLHRCGIVVQYNDIHSWNLVKFYEGMVVLHSPEVVIVFGDEGIARTWLGIK